MISRRNYLAITIVMLVIVVMFQATGVITEFWNDYEVNSYIEDAKELPGKSEAYSINSAGTGEAHEDSRDFLVYIGGGQMADAMEVWASYKKMNLEIYTSLKECENASWKENGRAPCMLVIDSDHIQWDEREQLLSLEACLEAGSDLIFCNMPDPSVIKSSRTIRRLFGIQYVKESQTKVDGVHLYDGFLLGGEGVYLTSDKKEQKKRQDLDLTLPWYELEAGTEVYMKGIMEGKDIESEEYPVIIWKKNYRDASVMAVNGKYMEDFGGIGLLSAITAQLEQYDLYPIVNAQNLIVADYPVLALENEEQLMNIYSRNMQGVGRDILWPGIMTVYRSNKMGFSCMMSPQLDYEDDHLPDEKQLHYYMKNLNKEDTEVGLSGISISDTPLSEKLKEDHEFTHSVLPDYKFSSFYSGDLDDEQVKAVMDEEALSSVRTVIADDRDDNEIVGWMDDQVTKQKVLSDGFTHTYRDDLRIRCVETMLGYTNVLLDVTDAVYPEDEGDSWEKLAEDLNWNLQNYWKRFRKFQGTTATESDERIRRFLSLDYSHERNKNNIYLHLSNPSQEPVWFLLRTHDEDIRHMEGGSFTKLEDDVFLLELENTEAVITMKTTALSYEY